MSKSYHVTAGFLSLLLLSACESDEKKLQRLRGDQAMACLLEQRYQRDYETASKPGSLWAAQKDSLGNLWMEYRTECDLATREYDRFKR